MNNEDRRFGWSSLPVVITGALISCFLWGSAFPCIKIGYRLFDVAGTDTAAQFFFAGVRFTLAGVLTLLMGSLVSRKLLLPKRESLLKICKLASLQTVAQYVFFYIGLAHTTGVRASIVEGMNVFIAILVASLIFRQEKLTARKVIGCVVGFAGVVLENLTGSGDGVTGNYWIGDLCVLLSTVAYAMSSVLLKRYSKEENPVVLSGSQFLIGGVFMSVVGFACGGRLHFAGGGAGSGVVGSAGGTPWAAIGMLLYLAFISAAAYTLWGILLKHNPISRVAVFGFMNPVFGVVLSAWLLGEGAGLGVWGVAALLLVCAGIYIVNRGK